VRVKELSAKALHVGGMCVEERISRSRAIGGRVVRERCVMRKRCDCDMFVKERYMSRSVRERAAHGRDLSHYGFACA